MLLGLMGCQGVFDKPPSLPPSGAIVREQLVVTSNFPLPKQHRLIEEVAAQRYDLSSKLGLPTSDEPIHVYLFDSESAFRSFLRDRYPDFPKRRAFFVETDTQLAVYAQWGDRVAEDLRHEVAHGYLHAIVPSIPLWLDEGLAEYFEVPRGQNGLNRAHVDDLAERLKAGTWQPDLLRLETLRSAGHMEQSDYAEAWAWVHLLLETDPERAMLSVLAICAQLRRDGKAEPLSSAIANAMPDAGQLLTAHIERLAQTRSSGGHFVPHASAVTARSAIRRSSSSFSLGRIWS